MGQETAPAAQHAHYVLVRTGDQDCAVPAADVVRVVRHLRCHAVPGSQARLLGLAQYGGEPLPVLDLHALVTGIPSGSRHHATVILGRARRHDSSALGLAVDSVLRVVDLPRPPPPVTGSGLVESTVRFEEGPVQILNTDRLLCETRDASGAIDE